MKRHLYPVVKFGDRWAAVFVFVLTGLFACILTGLAISQHGFVPLLFP